MAWGLLLALCGGLLAAAVHGEYHRLVAMVTGVTYENGTYQYAMNIQLDGVRIGRYSRETREARPILPWLGRALGSKYLQEKTEEFQRYEQWLKEMIGWCMQQDSQRGGIHTGQVYVGCSLSDEVPVDPQFQLAYDGQDLISFDNQTEMWVAAMPMASQLKHIWDTESTWTRYVQFFMRVDCLQNLRSLVQLGRWFLLSPVPPEVSVSRRDAPHGPVTLSCHASGFFPRPIHLSWVRDGSDVLAETSSSGILPLPDGTYHTQSSLEIGPRLDGPRYACRVEHSSLTAPALVWAPEKTGPLPPGVLAAIVLAVLGLAGAAGAGVWLWRRKSAGRRESGYAPAATKPGEDSASSSALRTENSSTGSRS